MKKIIIPTFLLSLFLSPATLALEPLQLVCEIYSAGKSKAKMNDIEKCRVWDIVPADSTSGKFYLKNIPRKPIDEIVWKGDVHCKKGGKICHVTDLPFQQKFSVYAIILYKDGTYEKSNVSDMRYGG